jgi:hypothetical protein
LSAPDDWPAAALRAEADLSGVSTQALRHGLDAALFPQLPVLAEGLPPGTLPGWRRIAASRMALNATRFARLEELVAEFGQAQIPVLLFKGGAAMLWAYGDRGRRELGDFDLLVRTEDVAPVRALMARLEYAEVSAYSSPEEEQLGIARVHLPPFVHPDGTVIEVHVNVLERRGNREVATPEIWRNAVQEGLAGSPLWRMSWTHFLLQTAVHYSRHLEEDYAPLKGLADMLAVVRRFGPELDWQRLWSTADRWGVSVPVARVLRTLQEHWALPVPGLPGGVMPLSAETLVTGSCPDPAGPAARGVERVSAVNELPDLASRCRYLFHLVFPTAEHLRWRYRLREGVSVAPYYFRYPLDRLRGLICGRPRSRSDSDT